MKAKLKALKTNFTASKCVMRFFAAWLTVNFAVTYLTGDVIFTQLKYAQDLDLKFYLLWIAAAFAVYTLVDVLLPLFNTDGWFLLLSTLLYAFRTVSLAQNYWFTFFLIIPIAAELYYLVSRRKVNLPTGRFSRFLSRTFGKESRKSRRVIAVALTAVCVTALGAFFVYIVGSIGAKRYLTYSSPNFDFGIFVNMFHNMKESFVPMVTCERDGFLSHFAVHASPIYYLLLPFYFIFPSPLTLQIGQAVILASGVAPLYFLCKKYDLKTLPTVLFEITYVCYPALAGGTFYDLHENCFLTPLLLWLFYFYEKRKTVPMFAFAVLTLCVKEDAAIYVAFFAIYVLLSNLSKKKVRELVYGGSTLVLAVVWFAVVTSLLAKYGDGVMTSSRYGNYMFDRDAGFAGIIKTVILNPGYVFTQFANAQHLEAKVLYIMQMMVPLAFTPFLTKKISRYVLVFPFVLMNLMTLYVYQYDIGFQYNFGVTAFFFWAAVMNVSEMKPVGKRFAVSVCAVSSALLMCVSCMPKFNYYNDIYEKNREQYEAMDVALERIPEDASVTCSTMLLAHLADRGEIYEVAYHDVDKEDAVLTDFVLIDTRYAYVDQLNKYYALGYKFYFSEARIFALIRSDLLPAPEPSDFVNDEPDSQIDEPDVDEDDGEYDDFND